MLDILKDILIVIIEHGAEALKEVVIDTLDDATESISDTIDFNIL